MLEELSKQPDKEREAKLAVLERFFKKELNANDETKKRVKKTRKELKELDKRFAMLFKKFSRARYLYTTDHEVIPHSLYRWIDIAAEAVLCLYDNAELTVHPRLVLFGYLAGCEHDHSDVDITLWDQGFKDYLANLKPRRLIKDKRSLAVAMIKHSHHYGTKAFCARARIDREYGLAYNVKSFYGLDNHYSAISGITVEMSIDDLRVIHRQEY